MDVVEAVLMNVLLDGGDVNVGNSVGAVEDTGDLLKGGSLGLGVHEVDPDEFKTDPDL